MKNCCSYLLILFFISGLSAQTQIGQTITGENSGDRFGSTTAISADGSIIAISAVSNDDNGTASGHVKVFENQNNTWIQIGSTIPGENEFDEFGRALSLSADGTILVIGTSANDSNGINSGYVRVFENVNNSWIQIGNNLNGIGESDQFGRSLSLSADGTVLAVGVDSGFVRIFENQNNSWIQVGTLIDANNSVNGLGRSISLSSDGSVIAVNLIDPNTFNFDIARVYENVNGNWVQIGSDINGDVINGGSVTFSSSSKVSLSSDGRKVAFTALGFDDNNTITRTLRIYENINGDWMQLGNSIFAEDLSDTEGVHSLSLSANGNIVALGSNANDGGGVNSGHVRVFENQNGIWIQIGNDLDGESAGDFFGVSVGLSDDSNTLVVGADGNDNNGSNSGHTKVYDLSNILSVSEKTIDGFKLYPNPAKDQITIELSNPSDLQNVTIYNSFGQPVLISKGITLDISSLASGLYIVGVTTQQGETVKKLIIQ